MPIARRPVTHYFSLLVLWALTQVPCAGQELRTTPTGEKIIVYADGAAVYFNDLTPISALNPGDSVAYPVLSVNIEPLGDALTPTQADLRRIAERRLNLAREALSLAGTRASAARENREGLETQLARARIDGNLTEVASLQKRLSLANNLERDANNDESNALETVSRTERIISEGTYVEAYNEERRKTRDRLESFDRLDRKDRQLSLLLPKEPNFTGYGAATARRGLREPLPCSGGVASTASNGAQPRTPLLPFFSFTEESLRPFLEGKEYLTARAYTSVDQAGENYLHLNLAFSNPGARNAYGILPSGTNLSIHLINGRTITLAGQRESIGIVNHLRQTLNYDVDYRLSRSDLSTLQREAIDYVRIFWSGGYEEYPVLRVDAVKEICRCL